MKCWSFNFSASWKQIIIVTILFTKKNTGKKKTKQKSIINEKIIKIEWYLQNVSISFISCKGKCLWLSYQSMFRSAYFSVK